MEKTIETNGENLQKCTDSDVKAESQKELNMKLLAEAKTVFGLKFPANVDNLINSFLE